MTGEALIFAGGRKRRERISCESFLCRLFNLIVVKLDNFCSFQMVFVSFYIKGRANKALFFHINFGVGTGGC